jgi:WS/DGAT/MGAT family acyltransferase
MMKRLGGLDKAFLLAESRETPMHVGGVSLYTLPEGADEQTFLASLAENMRDAKELLSPFGDRLQTGRLGVAGPASWEPDPSLDLEYHVRHSALPKPGRYLELFTLVSRLHGTLLDRNRPLWEMHLIEGLRDRQFAVYTKTHHAAVDGARSVHISRAMLSADPHSRLRESPLSLNTWERYKAGLQRGQRSGYSERELRNVVELLKERYDSGASIFSAVKGFAEAWTGRGGDLGMPFLRVPSTSLNQRIDGARRFVAQSWPFARIKAVATAFDGTFNDAVLAICSGALRQYMQTHDELPKESLKAMVPVSMREAGDLESGNAVAAITADLATSEADPERRLRAIQASVRAGKDYFGAMSPAEIQLFTVLTQLPNLVLVPLGLIDKLPPYNVAISNVPGIRETMYWNGARMDGNYPVSIVTHGMALNITLVTYDRNVDFGIIACRRSLPQVQRLIDYMEDALQELEDIAGITSIPARRGVSARERGAAPGKAGARRKRPDGESRAKQPARKRSAETTATARPTAKPKVKARPKAKPKVKVKAKAKAKSTANSKAKPKAKRKAPAGAASKRRARPKAAGRNG